MALALTACAPIGQPSCISAIAQVADKPVDVREYYECGKVVACGLWCRQSERCQQIEKEMELKQQEIK